MHEATPPLFAPPAVRTLAAERGIRLLKQGSPANVHLKGRAPVRCTLTLSDDECTLSWRLSRLGSTQRLQLADVVEVVPCDPTFQARMSVGSPVIAAAPTIGMHRTLTLLLARSLPPPPSDGGAASGSSSGAPSARRVAARQADEGALDLSFDDDEAFGMWVAALRALMAVWPEGRPQRRSDERAPARPGAATTPSLLGVFAALFGPPT